MAPALIRKGPKMQQDCSQGAGYGFFRGDKVRLKEGTTPLRVLGIFPERHDGCIAIGFDYAGEIGYCSYHDPDELVLIEETVTGDETTV